MKLRPSGNSSAQPALRGLFTSVKDLERKLVRYIRKYKNGTMPISWI